MQIDLLRQHISGYLGLRVEGEMDYRWSQESLGGKWKCSISSLWWYLYTYIKIHGNVHFKWVWFIACE